MGSDDGVQHSELIGFWTLSIVQYSKILKIREHNVSETSPVQWLRLALSKGPNWLGTNPSPLTWGRKQIQFPKRYVL
jgi:hypothetical protein